MYSRLLLIFLITQLSASCEKILPAKPEVTDTACDRLSIIYLTKSNIIVLEKQAKRDIFAYNRAG